MASMGSHLPFTENAADFGNICSDDIFISSMVQKIFFEADEVGVEAASVSAGGMTCTIACAPSMSVLEFSCDRPFFFIIHEKEITAFRGLVGEEVEREKAILFFGKVTDPTK